MNSLQYVTSGHELVLMPMQVKDTNRCEYTGQFLQGKTPWNKGKKGLCIGGVETQFKKGNEPFNTKYNGCISIRIHKRTQTPYKYIRISKSKWMLLHRYNWQQLHGTIPPKHIIAFKDGNTLNTDISNLMMLSMAQNCRRNYNREKAGESMKMAWRAEKLRAKYDLPRKTKLRIK